RVAAELDLRSLGYADSAGRLLERRLVERVSSLRGVRHVSTTQYLPLATTRMTLGVKVPGVASGLEVQAFDVGPDYFRTMGTRLLRGREFAASDDERAPNVVVVNEAMARKLWPPSGRAAVGRTLTIDTGKGEASYEVV